MCKRIRRVSGVGFASGTQVALAAAVSLILAKVLSAEEFGIVRTVTSYMVIFTMAGHFCLHDATAAYVAGARTPEERKQYVLNGSLLVIVISALLVLCIELLIHLTCLWHGKLKFALSCIVAFLPFLSLSIVYSALLQAAGMYRKLIFLLFLNGLIPLLIVIPSSSIWGFRGWVMGRAATAVILSTFAFFFIHSIFSLQRFDRKKSKELFSFARIQILSGILSMVMQNADIIALERLSGDMTEVASYGIAALFGKSVLFFPGSIGRVYFKEIASLSGTHGQLRRKVLELLLVTLATCVFISLTVFLFAPIIIKVVYGEKYPNSMEILNILCLGIVFIGIWTAISVVNVALRLPRFSVQISLVGTLSSIALLLWLVPRFGGVGAAWAMNASYASGCVVGFFLLFRFKEERDSLSSS